ncbi:MAG TPA: hypothetical protein VF814_03510 [Casimicrobiaceae bacterium]
MLKRFCFTLLLAGFTLSAQATDYTDMWFVPAESGWGVSFTQNENVIFMTFFIYGPDNKPTWYVAITALDANGDYTGSLYSTLGTYFGAPWNPADHPPATLAGTATFVPANAYQGTLTYTLIGGPTVVKSIVRETLVAIDLGGNYTGGYAGTYSGSGCGISGVYKDNFDLQVTQTSSNLTLTFSYVGLGESCTLSGAPVQNGQLYSVPSATYQCDDGLNTGASLSEIRKTAQGVEGRFAAPSVGGGCREDASFSAVNLAP